MYDLKMEMEEAISHLGNAVNNFSYGEQAEEFFTSYRDSIEHYNRMSGEW